MKHLTYKEFTELPHGTKVHRVLKGNVSHFFIVGMVKNDGVAVANDNNWSNIHFIHDKLFSSMGSIWTAEYNSNEIGLLMISQLEQEIETIREVYCKPL